MNMVETNEGKEKEGSKVMEDEPTSRSEENRKDDHGQSRKCATNQTTQERQTEAEDVIMVDISTGGVQGAVQKPAHHQKNKREKSAAVEGIENDH